MEQQQLISMTQKELSRYEIIQRLINREINGTEAAEMINLSVRQIKRIKARVIKEGPQGVIHQGRGRIGNRRINPETIEKAKYWLKRRYYDFQPTFAAEKLEENHQIKLSKEKVRQLMVNERLWKSKPRKKNKEYRHWRKRKDHYGEMEQFDGCYFDWLEIGENTCLLGSIDDATGKITELEFSSNEGFFPVSDFWKKYFLVHGKPLSIYLDRFSTYKNTHQSAIDNPDILTQLQRAMRQMDVKLIFAYSPQAKGRIERLWNTLQHRLVRELRLAKVKTIEQANQFLEETFIPKFNAQFSVVPAKKSNLHRKLTKIEKEQMESIFSHQEVRYVSNDFTVRYKGKYLQLDKTQPVLVRKKEKVLVEERADYSIHISLRGKYLNHTLLPERPEKMIKSKFPALPAKKNTWKPSANHPWRKFIINPNRKSKVKVQS